MKFTTIKIKQLLTGPEFLKIIVGVFHHFGTPLGSLCGREVLIQIDMIIEVN